MRPNLMRRDPHTQVTFPNRCTALLPHERTISLDGKTDTVRQDGLRLHARNQFSSGTDLGQCTLFRGAYS